MKRKCGSTSALSTHKAIHSSTGPAGGLAPALDNLVRLRGARFLGSDPLRFTHRYKDGGDKEVAALLAALFAYGNVKAMGAFLDALFSSLTPHPAVFLRGGDRIKSVSGYRFQRPSDVSAFLRAVGRVLKRYGSLEAAFRSAKGGPDERLEAFARLLRSKAEPVTPGLSQLVPLPSTGSACKRWRLFLRWVVRPDDGLDLGLWRCLSPSQLIIPVDVHVARIARALGLTTRATPDARFAQEVTAALARFCPEDPTRYDFALARLGILKECKGRHVEELCSKCPLRPHCMFVRGEVASMKDE